MTNIKKNLIITHNNKSEINNTFLFSHEMSMALILPLFIRGKLGTSKIDCGDKIQKKPYLFTFSSGKQAMTVNGSFLFRCAMITSVQKLIQVIKSNTTGFLRIHRHNRKILKRILNKLGLIKKDFLINTSQDM